MTRAPERHGHGNSGTDKTSCVSPNSRAKPQTPRYARRRRGVAIVMVIVILAGLVALCVPFVLSMLLHGRAARSDLYAAQAQAGSEGAMSHGLAHLYRNLLKGPGYDPTPDVDTVAELKVELGTLPFNTQDSKGIMWSAKVEDEQGKINVWSAPPAVIGNLLASTTLTEASPAGAVNLSVQEGDVFRNGADPGRPSGMVRVGADNVPYLQAQGNQILLAPTPDFSLTRGHPKGSLVYDARAFWISEYRRVQGQAELRPFRSIYEIKQAGGGHPLLALRADEFARIERFITVHSGRSGPAWGHAENTLQTKATYLQQGFRLEKPDGFGPGTLVRFEQAGKAINYALVRQVRVGAAGQASIILEDPFGRDVDNPGEQIRIAPEMRHPVNLNTAPPEVIFACVMGLGLAGDTTVVSREQAFALATFLSQRIFQNNEDLRKALNDARKCGILPTTNLCDAVYINATEPNSPKLRLVTIPFCYRSYGSYTLEGTSVVNGENGVQLARSTLREIVTLPVPGPGNFLVKSQEAFERQLREGMGQHVVTWSVPLPPPDPQFRRLPIVRKPDPNGGWVQLAVGETGSHKQGPNAGRGVLDEFLEHCKDPLNPAFFQDGYDISKHGPFRLAPIQGPSGFFPTTGVELWTRPRGNADFCIFDQGESDERNRATFNYEPHSGGFVIRIFDCNLQKKSTEYIWPCQFSGSQWYHIAGSWRSSLPGGQEVRLDGSPVPQNGPVQFKPSTKLKGSIKEDDLALEVEDFSALDLPKDGGAIRIGEEIIEYYERSGNKLGLVVKDPDVIQAALLQGKPIPNGRGMRLSTAAPHEDGEVVIPYGYACELARDHHPGRGLLVERLETTPQGCRVFIPFKPGADNFILHTDTTKIPVTSIIGFPTSGFIIVEGELIHYAKKTSTSASGPACFEKLTRALPFRTGRPPPRNLHNGSGVSLVSIIVTTNAEYDTRDERNYVQVDNEDNEQQVEWLGVGDKKSMNGVEYLLCRPSWGTEYIRTGSPEVISKNKERWVGIGEFRRCLGTMEYNHAKKAKVIPVANMAGPHCGDRNTPHGKAVGDDISTISIVTKGQKDGDLMYIKHACIDQYADVKDIWRSGRLVDWHFRDWYFEYWVGLNDFVSRVHPARNGRFIRFPSGELPEFPSDGNCPRTVGADKHGGAQMEGDVDEVKAVALNTLAAKIAWDYTKGLNYGMKKGEAEVLIEEAGAWPKPNLNGRGFDPKWPTEGFIRIDDELMYYTGLQAETIDYYADVYQLLDKNKDNPDQCKARRKWSHPKTTDNPTGPTDEVHPNLGDTNRTPTKYCNDGCERWEEERQVWKLTGVRRGVLNTDAEDHPPGAGVMLYDAAPFTVLTSGCDAGSDTFSVKNPAGFPEEGYAWINDEVLSWREQKSTTFTGCRVFRGRYGTKENSHPVGELVRCLPFRYWDRNATYYDGLGLAYIQAGHFEQGAVWTALELKITGTGNRPRILVRFDGQPEWDDRPTNRPGGLYQFIGDGQFALRGGGPGGGVCADQIEIRIFWQYEKGAFQPNPDWKRTCGLTELRAAYFSPMTLWRVDEIERR